MLKVLLKSAIAVTVLGASLIPQLKSIAEPKSIFNPVIDEIRNQLPEGITMRLPSRLPAAADQVKLYPYIMSNQEVFGVNLAVTPDCSTSKNPSACTMGGIGVFLPSQEQVWPPKGDSVTPIELGNGISGYYVTRGEGEDISQYVFWEQDGLKYAVGLGSGSTKDVSKQELIDMAASMANQSPISKSK